MKKLALIPFVQLVAALCSSAFALTNLVKNPGFEEGMFVGWRGSAKYASIDSDARGGTKALKIISDNTATSTVYQNISVKSGKVYTISAWIKEEGDIGGQNMGSYVFYWFFDPNGKVLNSGFIRYITNSPYVETKAYCLAPVGAINLRLELNTPQTSSGHQVVSHFDEVSVFEDEYVTNGVNIVTNPGFENDITGWTSNASSASSSADYPRSGSRSLKVNNGGAWAEVYQSVPVTPGEGVGFTGYSCLRTLSGDSVVTTNKSLSTWFYLSFMGPQSEEPDRIDIEMQNYTHYDPTRHSVIVPAGASRLWIQCWVYQGGPYLGYFDDISVIRFTKNPNPPGIHLDIRPQAQTPSNHQGIVIDALGRRIADPLKKSSKHVASGVYFTFSSSSRTVLRSTEVDCD